MVISCSLKCVNERGAAGECISTCLRVTLSAAFATALKAQQDDAARKAAAPVAKPPAEPPTVASAVSQQPAGGRRSILRVTGEPKRGSPMAVHMPPRVIDWSTIRDLPSDASALEPSAECWFQDFLNCGGGGETLVDYGNDDEEDGDIDDDDADSQATVDGGALAGQPVCVRCGGAHRLFAASFAAHQSAQLPK